MIISDKSIEAAAEKINIARLNIHISNEDAAKFVIEAYLAAERTQGRDWQAIEKLLPEYLSHLHTAWMHHTHLGHIETANIISELEVIIRAAMGKE